MLRSGNALTRLTRPADAQRCRKVIAGASTEAVHAAGAKLAESWERPVLFVWSQEDPVFAIDHVRRYAETLPDARIVEV